MKYEGGGGDLIVEGQGRVTASNQLTVALHSSIWDTVSLCMHVCVFSAISVCVDHVLGALYGILHTHLQETAKNTSLPSLFDPLTLALSILIIFYISVVFLLKKKNTHLTLYQSHIYSLTQGCPNSVLEGRCPAEFSSNLSQHTCIEVSSMPSKSLISCFRCV